MEPSTTELQKTSTFKFEDGSCLRTLAREIVVVTSGRNSLKLFFIHFFSPLFSTLHLQPELAPFVDEPSWLVATSEEVVAVLNLFLLFVPFCLIQCLAFTACTVSR